MDRFKEAVLMKEFPFLGEVCEVADIIKVDDIKIKIIDHNLLERIAKVEEEESQERGNDLFWRKGQMFFVVVSGKATALPYSGFYRDQSTDDHYSAGTIAEEIFNLGITAPDFIVELEINENLGVVKETFEHRIFIYRNKGLVTKLLAKKVRQAAEDIIRGIE